MASLKNVRHIVRGGAWGHTEVKRFRACRSSHANPWDKGAPELANHGFRTFRPARLAAPEKHRKARP